MAGNINKIKVGVFALQGCVEAHRKHLDALGVETVIVRKAAQLKEIDGLIIPGGESTTMLKLLSILNMEKALDQFIHEKPTWGICAGAILLARDVQSPKQKSFNALDISIQRNAYGRQLESFNTDIEGSRVAFIRAPKILSCGKNVQVRAIEEASPVWVQSGKTMVTTFHPELAEEVPSKMHQDFVEIIRKEKLQKQSPQIDPSL